ncbi:MAG: SRPBCC domain-containing protein [Bacteroidota bacterium]
MSKSGLTRRAVTCSIAIAAAPSRVFRALVEPQDVKRWWGANEAIMTARKGGTWSLGWHAYGQDNFYATTAFIHKIAHPRELQLTGLMYFRPDMKPLGPMKLSFRLEKKGQGVLLTVRQSGYGKGKHWDWYYRALQNGWEESLWSLKRYIERKGKRRTSRRTTPPRKK